jgi:phenylalanyl-tRNA synthetase alpha chain
VLHQFFARLGMTQLRFKPAFNPYTAGRGTALTPPDPQLKGAWYPGGFKPLPLNINSGFKMCRFKFSLHRYNAEPSMEIFAYHPMLKKWVEVGLYTLNPVVTHSLKAPGLNP